MRHSLLTLWVMAAVILSACARDDGDTTTAGPSAHTSGDPSAHTSGDSSGNSSGKPVSTVTVAAGEGKELCFESRKDDAVIFRFEADQPLQFDLHYHAADKTYFPIPEHTTAAEKGEYLVPRDNTYCLQWINGQNTAVELTADVEGAGPATWY